MSGASSSRAARRYGLDASWLAAHTGEIATFCYGLLDVRRGHVGRSVTFVKRLPADAMKRVGHPQSSLDGPLEVDIDLACWILITRAAKLVGQENIFFGKDGP